ncbi:translation initiation factor IF-2-like [Balaenoptera musculus]|uniref:Translation initiation factor IF-2-like n=1 Tax=Balaenoptera musculus TaxID=9771 RepID=A0A8B8WYM1_BALMU|nr:translation initiation factor IF-2-like [Balaenoptera musculus]
MGSSGARVRRDGLGAVAHSAPKPAAGVTASPGGGPFMRCRPSRRRRHRGSCLFLLGSAPPPQPPRIPPPGSKSPGLGLGRRLWVGRSEGLLAAGGPMDARAGGAAGVGQAERGVGPGRGAGRESGDWRAGEGGLGRAGGGGIRAAPVSTLRAVAVAATAAETMTPRSARRRSRETCGTLKIID